VFGDEQRVLYSLNSQDKIEECCFSDSFEETLAYAKDQFGVGPEEWTSPLPSV
jgi:hypothetical protein